MFILESAVELYQHMIEQLWTENRSLLAMLGVPCLSVSRRAVIPEDLCRAGANAIRRLTEQNEVLRQSVAERFPERDLDARLRA